MGPINYTSAFAQQGSPFSNFAQGLNVGAVMEQGQQRRDAIAQAQQAAEQQASQQAAAQAELQQLQQVPLAQMTQGQRLRLAQLSGSETTRGYLFREIERIPVEMRQARARSYGTLVTALASNPEIGKSRIATMIEAEKDPQERQALQLVAKAAEIDPMEAARFLHTSMSMGGEETSKIADSVMTFFENTGRPLYPTAPPKFQTVGGSVFNPRTQQFLQPPQKSDVLSPDAEAQKIRIARATNPKLAGGGSGGGRGGGSGGGSGGASGGFPTDGVGKGFEVVIDPDSGIRRSMSREEMVRRGLVPVSQETEITPKERQVREATYPKMAASIRGFDSKSDKLVTQLTELRDHPGLNSITGLVGGRIPGITDDGRRAEALFDSIQAQGGFQELQNMRNASPTGGALGNVSNQEGQFLRQAWAALDRRQSREDMQKAIDDAIESVRGAKGRLRGTFDETYAYRESGGIAPTAREVADARAPAPPAAMSPEDKQALAWAQANKNDPRAAQIRQRLGVK
jgi:hypothetical protein